jgi:Fe-S-cluster-containing hydrogenase component 2
MAFVIVDSCVACEACALACPRDAVRGDGQRYWIEAQACDECHGRVDMPLCLQVCPADCINPSTETGVGCDDGSDRPDMMPVPFPRSRFQTS